MKCTIPVLEMILVVHFFPSECRHRMIIVKAPINFKQNERANWGDIISNKISSFLETACLNTFCNKFGIMLCNSVCMCAYTVMAKIIDKYEQRSQ